MDRSEDAQILSINQRNISQTTTDLSDYDIAIFHMRFVEKIFSLLELIK